MKHTKIMSIYYGAFEELGPAYKVRNMEIEDRNASIINLTNIAKLQKLTETATEFTAFGKIKRLSENISAEGGHLEGKAASAIEEVCDAISDIDDYISTCRMNDIKKGSYMIHFTNNIQRVRNSILPNPIKIILESLQIELSEFKNENSYDNIKAAIKWARKYNMLPQAYTLSQEYIVSLVAERLKDYNPYRKNIKMKNTDRKKKFREFISAMLAFDETKELRDELKVHEEIVHSMLLIDWIKELRKEYKCLTKGRNSIDHAKGDLTASDLDDILKEYYPKCIKILESVPC
jgi:Trp operon repressor